MPIFYNEAIFDSAEDFELGGFVTDKTDNITYADIFEEYSEKISDYIDEYLSIAVESYALQGYESPQTEAINALALVVQDNLKIDAPYNSKEQILNTIIQCDQSQKWLLKIKERVENYPQTAVSQQFGIKNITDNTKSKLYKEAKEIMEDSSLESIIERLSTIEL
jgi:hypothetical protein